MKIRLPLLSFFLGLLVATLFTGLALQGNNIRWQFDAYEHYAAVWKIDMKTGKKSWMWMDDYFVEKLTEMHHATPTPEPITEKL